MSRPPNIGRFAVPRPRLVHRPDLQIGGNTPVTDPGRLGPDIAFFHDGTTGVNVTRNSASLLVATAGFDGSYVSFALDLPSDMADDLNPEHDLRLRVTLGVDRYGARPGACHARLCVQDNGEPWRMTVPFPAETASFNLPVGPDETLPPPIPGVARKAWVDLVISDLPACLVLVSALALTRDPGPVV